MFSFLGDVLCPEVACAIADGRMDPLTRVISSPAILCSANLFYIVLCYVMLCYDMIYYAMICHAMLCDANYDMICHAMICHAM